MRQARRTCERRSGAGAAGAGGIPHPEPVDVPKYGGIAGAGRCFCCRKEACVVDAETGTALFSEKENGMFAEGLPLRIMPFQVLSASG